MKKFGMFALVLALTGALCACNRVDRNTHETTGNTMPTVITTLPTTEDVVPNTSHYTEPHGTTDATESTQGRSRLRLR